MKKLYQVLCIMLSIVLVGCTNTIQTASSVTEQATEENTILVAYFSRTGTTEEVANKIIDAIDADIFVIEAKEPYSSDYQETIERFRKEREEDARPEVKDTVENMEKYDVVFVGYPIWEGTMPYVVRTFLESYDLSDKVLIPFCTSGGSGIQESTEVMKQLCPDSTVEEGRNLTQASNEDIEDWLNIVLAN